MSTAIAKNFQVGSDSTATNNFTIRQPATPDGTVRIANGNSGTTTDLVTVTSAGNVGVGTTSPGSKLDVTTSSVTAGTFTGASTAIPGTAGFWNNTVAGLDLYDSAGGSGYGVGVRFRPKNSSSTVAGIAALAPSSTSSALVFHTQDSNSSVPERMRLDSSGNLGIGTSSPSWMVSVRKDSASASTGQYPVVQVNNANASGYAGLYLNDSTALAGLETRRDTAHLGMYAGGSERARITSGGNLLVGTTSNAFNFRVNVVAQSVSNPAAIGAQVGADGAYALGVQNASGTNVGGVIANTSSTSYATSSDYRLKENIQPMTGALAKVTALKPVTYKWKATGGEADGFIAHELAEVCPQAVTGEKDAVDADGTPKYQGIDTSFLVATLTAAIQELKAELDSVKTELALLKGTA